MKDRIIEFIEACEEYPETLDLVSEICDLVMPLTASRFINALLELIDEGKIFYDPEDETWEVLKEK